MDPHGDHKSSHVTGPTRPGRDLTHHLGPIRGGTLVVRFPTRGSRNTQNMGHHQCNRTSVLLQPVISVYRRDACLVYHACLGVCSKLSVGLAISYKSATPQMPPTPRLGCKGVPVEVLLKRFGRIILDGNPCRPSRALSVPLVLIQCKVSGRVRIDALQQQHKAVCAVAVEVVSMQLLRPQEP